MTSAATNGLRETTLEEIRRQVDNKQAKNEMGASLQLIIFKLNGEEYALPIEQIKEVVLTPPIAKIPHTEKYIKGVANIRGTVIAIMDFEERFGLESGVTSDKSFNYTLVIESDTHKVGILVKDVPNTLSVRESEIDRSSGIMQFSSHDVDCIDGIVKIGNRLIVLMDVFKMMGVPEVSI